MTVFFVFFFVLNMQQMEIFRLILEANDMQVVLSERVKDLSKFDFHLQSIKVGSSVMGFFCNCLTPQNRTATVMRGLYLTFFGI